MARRVLTCFLIMALPYLLLASTVGKIAGICTDDETGKPLMGVNIVLKGTMYGAASGTDGRYFILNVPPGLYEVEASYIGYKKFTITNVRVIADITTTVNMEMVSESILGEEVIVVAERPLIQKDLTSSRTITTSNDMERMAIDDVNDVIALGAGAVEDQDGNLHLRGGREEETIFLVDGVSVVDPLTGQSNTNIPRLGLEEASVLTSGFSAEYGSAQSGIVNLVMKEGGSKTSGALRFKYSTPAIGGNPYDEYGTQHHEHLQNIEFSLGGPEPISTYLLGMPNVIKYHIAGEYKKSDGYLPGQYSNPISLSGKLTVTPTSKIKLQVTGLTNWNKYGVFGNLWKVKTYEDKNENFNNPNSENYIAGWYDNGILDSEWDDLNEDGEFQVNEWTDLNNNKVVDTEDLNHNGRLDIYNMLDNLYNVKTDANQFSFKWTHTLSPKTFYEVQFSRYEISTLRNVVETTNEDRDGDGRFELYSEDVGLDGIAGTFDIGEGNGLLDYEDKNGNGKLDAGEDINNNGLLDSEDRDGDMHLDTGEDLNGNGVWDFKEYGENRDLYKDENHNGYIDASEVGPSPQEDPEASTWMTWSELPSFGLGEKDSDGFYTYGLGNTYHRLRWTDERKRTYSVRFSITSQITSNHQLKAGIEGHYYELMSYRVDYASGGNVYGEDFTVYPNAGAVYIQDKMEYPETGIIINAGLRYDFFNANYNNYPSDVTNPVVDPTRGGEVLDPVRVPIKNAWSPRLGISFPITDKDLMHFNYGRYFQTPRLDYAFENINWDFSGAFPRVGNPNLEPELTTSYEVGVIHQFTENLAIDVTTFYKDITGLTNVKQVYYTVTNWYGLYQNADYGNVRGFELKITKRPSNYTVFNINYTFSHAKGKNSSAVADYSTVWRGDIVPAVEQYLDWDQRHTISANFDVHAPYNKRIFGIPFTKGVGINVITTYGSGLPWSLPSRNRLVIYNTERMPYTTNTDIIFDKNYKFGHILSKFYVEVKNVFNRKNILDLADEQWYQTYGDADGQWDDPTVYSQGRVIRFGVRLSY